MEVELLVEKNRCLNLISTISDIQIKFNKQDELIGSNYNLFNVLGISRKETIHSNMIANLLDKNANHGYRVKFLEALIMLMKNKFSECENLIKVLENLELSSCKIYKEYRLGSVTSNKGGIIDILIRDRKSNSIVIENKICAKDQLNQLIRYKNSLKNCAIIYLTLEGDEPSKFSCKNLKNNTDYVCLNYKNDMLNWLEVCRDMVNDKINLKNSLTQYIYIIKELTDQPTNDAMEKELVSSIVKDNQSIRAAFEISKSINMVKAEITKDLLNAMLYKLGSQWYITPWEFKGEEEQEIWLHYKGWETHAIVLSFEAYLEKLDIGIYRKDDQESKNARLRMNIGKALSHFHLGEIYDYTNWIWLANYEKWSIIDWADLKEDMKLEEDITYLINVLNDFDL
jgi:hypothetical protein